MDAITWARFKAAKRNLRWARRFLREGAWWVAREALINVEHNLYLCPEPRWLRRCVDRTWRHVKKAITA